MKKLIFPVLANFKKSYYVYHFIDFCKRLIFTYKIFFLKKKSIQPIEENTKLFHTIGSENKFENCQDWFNHINLTISRCLR